MNEIFKRAKQFFRAACAKISAEDEIYISRHLSDEERKLFFAMSTVDQAHCLNTAHTIEKIAGEGTDKNFLIRCALLHDVGRVKGDMSIAGKIFCVLVHTFSPKLADKLEIRGNREIYVYRHHAELGAEKLQKIGLLKESEIVAAHHSPEKIDDPPELKLLRSADEQN